MEWSRDEKARHGLLKYDAQVCDLFDAAPFLAPWSIAEEKPALARENTPFTWTRICAEGGTFAALTEGERIFGLIGLYGTIHPAPSGRSFCVWGPSGMTKKGWEVDIELYETKALLPILDREAAFEKIGKEKPFYMNGAPLCALHLTLGKDVLHHTCQISEAFSVFEEIPLLTHIKGVGAVLAVINPKENSVSVYPQDWFNNDKEADFDYEWITRIFKNPETGRYWGRGMRIGVFELDETNRNIKRWV